MVLTILETPQTQVLSPLANYGVLGLVVIGLCWYVMYLHKQARYERMDWKEIAKDGQEAMKENTSILSSLKTLLETTREKR